jgi:hypothetical protein
MIKTISRYDFEDSFNESDTYKNNFSYEGKLALYEYLTEYEEDTGEQIELDIVALCCDYTEYENLSEVKENYTDIKNMEDLQDHTQVIPIKGTDRLIIANY